MAPYTQFRTSLKNLEREPGLKHVFAVILAMATMPLLGAEEALHYQGVTKSKHGCYLSLNLSEEGDLTSIGVRGVFNVTYHIPAPGSGLFGRYQFPIRVSYQREGVTNRYERIDPIAIHKGPLGRRQILKTSIHPVADIPTPKTKIKMVLNGTDYADLKRIDYWDQVRIFRMVPFVTRKVTCLNLERVSAVPDEIF